MSRDLHILSEDIIFSIINHITEMVVGVEKIIGIYTHPETEELCGITLQYRNNRLQEYELDLSNVQDRLHGLRQEKNKYRWLDHSQIPFDTHFEGKYQLNIFDELNHLILLITIPNESKSEKDVLLIYFKNDINAFGIQHQKSSLSTDNKSIIGHLLAGSVHSYCKLYWQEKDKFNRFTEKTSRILAQQRTVDKSDTRKKELEAFVLSWANQYIRKCSDSDGIHYVYSQEAEKKIKDFKGEFITLQKAIEEAVEYTKLIVTGVNKEIQAEYIELNIDVNTIVSKESLQDETHLSIRLQRVSEFLNRLEAAAIHVDRMGNNLTGTNIGSAMEDKL
ncbi:hypothetical protein [Saccharicrinis fermentans]|uniref:Uncharacterized protein n=1 Tax=Saccharicrinis fermentans DSM 9555 = JCM 21142 TaxID=869213 RepID=W7Y489_9BACT|nr:hypothetical protein [Saccharicrinis fermentans]GAF02388.1 hypothetical protein JCM21142_31022 [Saccharicrinis fermentans DSM 9555 = JCM 21142]